MPAAGHSAQAAGTGRAEEADIVTKSILHLQSCSLGYRQLNYSCTEVRSSNGLFVVMETSHLLELF